MPILPHHQQRNTSGTEIRDFTLSDIIAAVGGIYALVKFLQGFILGPGAYEKHGFLRKYVFSSVHHTERMAQQLMNENNRTLNGVRMADLHHQHGADDVASLAALQAQMPQI